MAAGTLRPNNKANDESRLQCFGLFVRVPVVRQRLVGRGDNMRKQIWDANLLPVG